MSAPITRRRFMQGAAGVGLSAAGLASLAGCGGQSMPAIPAASDPPLETPALRLSSIPAVCLAPQYVAEELLRAEGFTDIQYVGQNLGIDALLSGAVDLTMLDLGSAIGQLDAGRPVVLLAGVHAGCYELIVTNRVQTIRDLKGKTVAVPDLTNGRYYFVAAIIAYIGLDPKRDINWITRPPDEAMQLLADGEIDAVLGFPPEPQELRAKGIGHLLVSTTRDRPWSQYFCCFVTGRREFVQKHPGATKRALRAILKATDVCAADPVRVTRSVVDKGYARNYDYTLEALQGIPYDRWREYDPEDTVRFYALRLHEAGIIKTAPDKLIAQGTDWRFFNELKRELKA